MEKNETKEPVLTVVIPHLNNDKGLLRCLKTLKMMTSCEYRVILINQSGRSKQKLIESGLVHLSIDSYRNLGFAKACNFGLRLADTEYVMLCNDDVEFIYDKWWEDTESELKRLNKQAACYNPGSPRNPNGTGDVVNQWEYKDVLTGARYTPEEIEAIKVKWQKATAPGICMFAPVFRLDALRELGVLEGSKHGIALLDEMFGQGSGEDYDMCRRFGIRHMQCFGGWRAIVWHWWGDTKNNMPKKEDDSVDQNYRLISGGYATMERKWGKARHGPNPDQNPDGWDVQGHHGPKEPLDGLPWNTVVPL